jgi:hypothetical protein
VQNFLGCLSEEVLTHFSHWRRREVKRMMVDNALRMRTLSGDFKLLIFVLGRVVFHRKDLCSGLLKSARSVQIFLVS